MNDRITLVIPVSKCMEDNINKLVTSVNVELCKVPFKKNIKNRKLIDTLPFHITLCAWDKIKQKEIIEKLKDLEFNKFNIRVNKIKIKNSSIKKDCFVVYLAIEKNEQLINLQKQIYNLYPQSNYNPQNIDFHITMHIGENIQTIEYIKQSLEENFVPFDFECEQIKLYEIYPAKSVYSMELINEY